MIAKFLKGGGVKSPPDFILIIRIMTLIVLVYLLNTGSADAKVTTPVTLTAKLLNYTKTSDSLLIEVVITASVKSALSLKCDAGGLYIQEGKNSLQLMLDRNETRKISYIIHKPDRNSFAEISFILKSESGITRKALIKVNSDPDKQPKAVIKNGVREIGP